jgi:hypothetical protein
MPCCQLADIRPVSLGCRQAGGRAERQAGGQVSAGTNAGSDTPTKHTAGSHHTLSLSAAAVSVVCQSVSQAGGGGTQAHTAGTQWTTHTLVLLSG